MRRLDIKLGGIKETGVLHKFRAGDEICKIITSFQTRGTRVITLLVKRKN
jgi:hypothetical protein